MIIFDDYIKLCSINNKYVNRRFALTNEYQNFKVALNEKAFKFNFQAPFKVEIWVTTSKDIDATIKPILDGIEPCLGNDKHVYELIIHKSKKKKLRDLEHLKIEVTEI